MTSPLPRLYTLIRHVYGTQASRGKSKRGQRVRLRGIRGCAGGDGERCPCWQVEAQMHLASAEGEGEREEVVVEENTVG